MALSPELRGKKGQKIIAPMRIHSGHLALPPQDLDAKRDSGPWLVA